MRNLLSAGFAEGDLMATVGAIRDEIALTLESTAFLALASTEGRIFGRMIFATCSATGPIFGIDPRIEGAIRPNVATTFLNQPPEAFSET